jgi:hypothetical protein
MCSDFLYDFSMKYFLCYDEFSEILLSKHIGLHVTYQLLLSDSNETLNFTADFRRILEYQIS